MTIYWHGELTDKIKLKRAEIENSGKDQNEVYFLLKNELHKLADLKHIYSSSTTLQKQELLRTVFDSSLYYHNSLYRTTFMMDISQHTLMILKEKKLLELDINKKAGPFSPASWR